MDIYQQSLSFLNIDIEFNEQGIFSCELQEDKGNSEDGFLFTAIKNTSNLTLSISLASNKSLPSPIPDPLFLVFADQSLAPICGGIGLGVLPGTRQLVAYRVIALDSALDGSIQEAVLALNNEIEQWNELIDKVQNTHDPSLLSRNSDNHRFLKV